MWSLLFLFLKITSSLSVEVHFESADSGFFIKHVKQNPIPQDSENQKRIAESGKEYLDYDSILSVDRFTIIETNKPVSIRATYGPFSTKQTVPARNIVPDVTANNTEAINNTTAALIELQRANTRLDISAHVVRPVIYRDSPVLRVLFHAGAEQAGQLQRQNICVMLYATSGKEPPLKGRCVPEGDDGVCLAEVIIPSSWWSLSSFPIEFPFMLTQLKQPLRHVHVSYSVFEPPSRRAEECEPKIQVQPLTTFVDVPLSQDFSAYNETTADGVISIYLPKSRLFPLSKFYAPVFLKMPLDKVIASIIIKARIKTGFKLLKVSASSEFWNISVERESAKQTFCKLVATLKDADAFLNRRLYENITESTERWGEIFAMLFEVGNETSGYADGKIVWAINYVYLQNNQEDTLGNVTNMEIKRKIVAKLEFFKDDIQAIIPMAKSWELINTAMLTGRQVAQAMKIFIVSQSGKVADVTLQSSCQAADESVIKVSSSCSSVYVDGSEIRGSYNASIVVKYGTYTGLAKFIVWMPELPLEVYVADAKLSQIKGWKIPDEIVLGKNVPKRRKRSYYGIRNASNYYTHFHNERIFCKTRYQQSPVEVFSKFVAIDQDSGRVSYFISRRTSLRITDLVLPLLRVADPKIAYLNGRILQGKAIGRTEVQVLSPITGRIIGAKEIRVGSDKILLKKIVVRVISGLQLSITPDNMNGNMYFSETTVTNKLTAQYQEGLLDIDLEFSDGFRTPLREVNINDYFLQVDTLDNEVVAFAPMLASHHPRVIAIGEGHGDLLKITMLLPEMCRAKKFVSSLKYVRASSSALGAALAPVDVVFKNIDPGHKQENIQNDGVSYKERKFFRPPADLSDITEIAGLPFHGSDFGKKNSKKGHHYHNEKLYKTEIRLRKKQLMTSMEFGMFILLTAFCFAIIVFVISCIVYATKFRKTSLEAELVESKEFRKAATSNVHDWVWLGRSSMDKPGQFDDVNIFKKSHDHQIRITTNPISNINSRSNVPVHIQEDINKRSRNIYKPPVPPHRQIVIANECSKPLENKGEYGKENVSSRKESAKQEMNNPMPSENTGRVDTLKLLSNLNNSCKNGFQFDTDALPHVKDYQEGRSNNTSIKSSNASIIKKQEGLKKAKIVGNPMFLKSSDMIFNEEKFNIDNLDMDYEQIMEYFNGLKESNA